MFQDLTVARLIENTIVLILAMAVHEFAHAYVAYLNGDNTAKQQGRMTLDPRANIHPAGFLMAIFIGFGILGSAPVNPYRMRNPRWGYLAAVAAGPFSNLLLAIVFAIPFLVGINVPNLVPAGNPLLPGLRELLISMVYINVAMWVFNLLPFSPLDGWTVVYTLLPPDAAIWWERNRQNSMYVGIGLLIWGFVSGYIGLGMLNPLRWLFDLTVFPVTNFLLSPLIGG